MIKNVIAYAVTPGFNLDPELLRRQIATECGASQSHSEGFTAPCPHSTAELVHQVAGYTLICWQTEDKILPSSVVEEVVAAKAAEIEETQGIKLGRKARRELKEQVVDELLPRAFVQKRKTLALFGGGYLIINTSSKARAQGLIECLRKALEGVPLKGLRLNHEPSAVMANWLANGEPPDSLTIDRDCVLQSAEEAQVKYVRKDVDTDEVRSLIADGYRPTKLGMTYADRVSFVLGEDLAITRLSLLDVIRAEAQESTDIAAEQFDVDMTLESGEIIRLLDHLIESLGGLRAEESDNEELPLSPAQKMNALLAEDGATATIESATGEVLAEFNGEDPLYGKAKAIVIDQRRASISLVQRHLTIGYNRAARLIERMERDGVISTPDTNGARTVLEAA